MVHQNRHWTGELHRRLHSISWRSRYQLSVALWKSPGYFSGILNPQTSEASEIYSADGKLIGKYFNENRTPVTYEEVNPDFSKPL